VWLHYQHYAVSESDEIGGFGDCILIDGRARTVVDITRTVDKLGIGALNLAFSARTQLYK
jgi:hypothetical protein